MLKMKTSKLQEIVSKLNVIKENRLLLITSYWHIYADEYGYQFTAYDGSGYLKIYGEDEGDIDVIVKSSQFGRLIEKTTSEYMEFEMSGGSLKVKGNGEYLLEVASENEEYPDFEETLDGMELPASHVVDPQMFNDIVNVNDGSVSKSGSDGVLQAYYFDGGKVITTDSFKICINPNNDEISSNPILMDPRVLDAIGVMDGDDIDVYMLDDDRLLVEGDNISIFAKLYDGIENYPDVSSIENVEFEMSVELPTDNIKSILDRLSLFIRSYDNNIVKLNFKQKHLEVETFGKSVEKVTYMKGSQLKKGETFSCFVNSQLLNDILNGVAEEKFLLEFGDDSLIGISSQGVKYFLALAEGEE